MKFDERVELDFNFGQLFEVCYILAQFGFTE
jgi:hypothetical protein